MFWQYWKFSLLPFRFEEGLLKARIPCELLSPSSFRRISGYRRYSLDVDRKKETTQASMRRRILKLQSTRRVFNKIDNTFAGAASMKYGEVCCSEEGKCNRLLKKLMTRWKFLSLSRCWINCSQILLDRMFTLSEFILKASLSFLGNLDIFLFGFINLKVLSPFSLR